MRTDAETRLIVDEYCRAHQYVLTTRDQAERYARALDGVVTWDEHRRAVLKVDAELAKAHATIAQLAAFTDTVEMQARDAVEVARAVGLHLGPLSAALDELTAARARAQRRGVH